jgi:hypothetical protein
MDGAKVEYRCIAPCKRSAHCHAGLECDCYPQEVTDPSVRGCVATGSAMAPAGRGRGP